MVNERNGSSAGQQGAVGTAVKQEQRSQITGTAAGQHHLIQGTQALDPGHYRQPQNLRIWGLGCSRVSDWPLALLGLADPRG